MIRKKNKYMKMSESEQNFSPLSGLASNKVQLGDAVMQNICCGLWAVGTSTEKDDLDAES